MHQVLYAAARNRLINAFGDNILHMIDWKMQLTKLLENLEMLQHDVVLLNIHIITTTL